MKSAYGVQIEERLMMFVHWWNSLYGIDVFLISQVEMRERDDDRSAWKRKIDYIVGENMDRRGECKRREKRRGALCNKLSTRSLHIESYLRCYKLSLSVCVGVPSTAFHVMFCLHCHVLVLLFYFCLCPHPVMTCYLIVFTCTVFNSHLAWLFIHCCYESSSQSLTTHSCYYA